MKIIINTAHQRFGGAVQVALSFIVECRHFPQHEYHVWLGSGVGKFLNRADFPANFFFYDFDFGVINFRTIRKIQRTLSAFEAIIRPQIIIATSGPSYFHSRAPQLIGFNLPLILYSESLNLMDLSIWKRIKFFFRSQIQLYYFKRDGIAFFAQTDDVNKRIRKVLKTINVHTVSNTHNSFFLERGSERAFLRIKEVNEFRFLIPTAYYPHKNLELINQIVEILDEKGITFVRFVFTLNPFDYQRFIKPHPFIINIGPVKPAACPSLYQECDGMFLPTLAECFSASYPEAMIMEKPIITTDFTFTRSICGEAALYFKPKVASDAFSKIIRLVQNPDLIVKITEKGRDQLKKFDDARGRASKYLEFCERYGNS